MNLDKILDNKYYQKLEKNDVAKYSLTIGLEEYFATYHRVYIKLSKYDRDQSRINYKCNEMSRYAKSYLNVAIHIQHFFELETKRLLEEANVLYAVDTKGDVLILNKLLNNEPLDDNVINKLKSVEFSEAIHRLKKLVDTNKITDKVAKLFADHYKLLQALNNIRNTIIHRGKKIMLYTYLDELFACEVLPFVKDVIDCGHYSSYLFEYKQNGYYNAICNIIKEGKKVPIDYSKIAYEKEMARCTAILVRKEIAKGKESKDFISKLVDRRIQPYLEEVYDDTKQCPCCENKTVFCGRELIGYDMDELGDETSNTGGFSVINIPEYAIYYKCALCEFSYTDFLDI